MTGDEPQGVRALKDAIEVTHGETVVLARQRLGARAVSLLEGVDDAAMLVLCDDQQVDRSIRCVWVRCA